MKEMDEAQTKFEEIFGDRIASGTQSGQWMVYDLTVSEMTASKFVERAKQAGYKVFMRSHKTGYLIE